MTVLLQMSQPRQYRGTKRAKFIKCAIFFDICNKNNKLNGQFMIKTKRLFLALVITDETKQAINQWQARHMESLYKKPVPADNYHVTLVYMGAIEQSKYDTVVEKLREVRSDNFQLTITKTQHFKNSKTLVLTPSTIPPKLIELQRNINRVVKQAGLPYETRTYNPHVTLFRKINDDEFAMLEEDGLPLPHFEIPVDHFALFESISTETGVHYRMLEDFELHGEYA